ncbi:hypothetical protein G4D82_04825, partial [Flavobacterium sp. CYK-4]|uniref:beta strand repeat-containing protein n=1 Tax=Flavobacterium lotistagni TaxID=2709660 RepID=UPI001A9C4CFE
MKSTFSFLVVFLMLLLGVQNSYAQPPNDACASAEPLTVGVGSCNSILYTNVAATSVGDPSVPACWLPNSLSHSVWFSFVATVPDIEISTNFGGTLSNTQIAVYSGTCGALTFLGCQEDVNTAGGLLHTNMILHGLTVGNTYYILVDGNGNTTGDFGICTQESLPVGPALPTQDCSGAQTLCNLNSISVGDGAGGVGTSQEFPSCFGAPGERSSNWYTFTAATSGTLCFTINPNTNIDYDFAVYNSTASCPGVELSCNWSPTSPITGLGCPGGQCETCLTVTAGQTYSILVDRFTAASNSGFTLDFAGTTATFASPNPTFTATTACIGSPTQFTNTTNGNFTYSWNFGDGFTSNLENPSHTFATTGPHSVTLLLTAVPGGCQNSVTQTVTVNPLPTVNAGTASSVCSGGCVNLSGSTNAVGATGPVSFSNNSVFNIPDNDPTGVSSTINVSGISPVTLSNTSIVSVCIDITHDFDGDLDIYLVAPNGTQIELSTDNGGGNSNYTNTCFSSTATSAITAGAAPFTGTFTPEQAFSLLNGSAINGTWQLFVVDDSNIDVGTINNWSIALNNNLPAFSWTPTTAMTNVNTLTPTVCPTAPTTYTLTANNGPGCTASSQVTVGVTAGPTAVIQYTAGTYCTTASAQTVTLTGTGAYTGGTYASSAGLSINPSTGTITPSTSTPGPYIVSYTIPASGSCSSITVTTNVTITAPPIAGTLSGNQNICVGQTSSFTSTSAGGTWTSSDVTVATIGSVSGLVTAVASGTATMTYTVLGTGGCANVSATRTVTVTAPPVAGTLSGNQNICVGQTSAFSSTSSGGTWVSSDVTVATINSASGLVTAVASGTATMTYTVLGTGGCANVSATRTVNVTAPPIVGTLSGNQNICVGQTSVFASTSAGGTWVSSDVTVATIGSASGLVTAVAAGTATMTYTVLGTGGCANVSATRTVNVTAPPIAGTLSGNQNICVGQTSSFTSTSAGGTWVSSDVTVATIGSASGLVTAVAAGTATMTYTVLGTGGCANVSATRIITVTAPPVVGTLSGNQNICVGQTSSFASTSSGGTWVSSDVTVATIGSASGLVTAVASGTATMTYTVLGTGGCANVSATRIVTVNPYLSPTINCGVSSTTSVTFNWAALVGATDYSVSYQINGGAVVNVGSIGNLLTYSVGGLSPGDSVALALNPIGSVGTCFNPSSATCTANNCTPPTANIIYPATNVCTTDALQTVNLTGTGTFSGGVYSSTVGLSLNAASGDINPSSSAPGLYTITYTLLGTAGCPNVTAATNIFITAPPIAGTLSGNQNICVGQTSAFTSTSAGGTWTSSDVTVATIGSASGLVTAVAAGTATMTYTVLGTGGCANVSATRTVTVTAPPIAGTLSGNQNICVGQTSSFTSTSAGGTWTSSDVTVATIGSASGLVTAVASGTATMTYTVLGTGGCANVSATRTVNVTAPPVVGTLSGNQNICVGQTSSFTSTSAGGTWTSSDSTVATIGSASGLLTAVAAGTATMTYTVLGTGGCANVSATRTVTVTAPPVVGTLSGNQNICVGQTSSFTSTSAGGTWTSSDVTVATIGSASGLVTAVAAGTATMTYTVLGTGGCANVSATRTVTVTAPPIAGTLSGNQNICVGQTSTFTSTSAGGTWASSDSTVATIGSASGLVTAVAAGTATMTYTVLGTGGCVNVSATRNVTVNPYLSPTINCGVSSTNSVTFNWTAVIGATDYSVSYQVNGGAIINIGVIGNLLTYVVGGLSPGDSVALTLTPIGAAGTCFNPSSATCTANNCTPPTANIIYPATNVCTTDALQTVNLTGTGTFSGGIYSSTVGLSLNATSGDINPSSSAPGLYTITYTLLGTAGCPNVTAATNIFITAPPIAGTLSGNQNICVGQTSSFTSTSAGGTWTSSDVTVATIGSASGLVTAVASGTATMTYTVLGTGGCANVSATRTVNVTAPPIAGTLSGNQNI